jgi:hypothetical protein
MIIRSSALPNDVLILHFGCLVFSLISNRMFVIDRIRGGDMDCPVETMSIAGSTGNVYTIKIDRTPTCDCPQGRKAVQCKHILFALVRVLRAPAHLQFQLAFLEPELREIFGKAPSILPIDVTDSETSRNRKSISPDDNCPICFMEFEQGYEDTVFCKAVCGNNIHKECMEQWSASRNRNSAPVTCPYCRNNWVERDSDVMKTVAKFGAVNEEGYVNVASELGLPTSRGKEATMLYLSRRTNIIRLFHLSLLLGSQACGCGR